MKRNLLRQQISVHCVLICWNSTVAGTDVGAIKTSLERKRERSHINLNFVRRKNGRGRSDSPAAGIGSGCVGSQRGEEFFQFCKSVINKGEAWEAFGQELSSGFRWGSIHVSLTFSSGIVISRIGGSCYLSLLCCWTSSSLLPSWNVTRMTIIAVPKPSLESLG